MAEDRSGRSYDGATENLPAARPVMAGPLKLYRMRSARYPRHC